MASPLEVAIDFLDNFGFFQIVLPFILVFTLVYAILDKTKILGSNEGKGKANINALFAFAVALFVVSATNIVNILREAIPVITLVLVVLISFMLLYGSLHGDKEFELSGRWKWFLSIVIFIGVILIFMNFIKTDDGDSWLEVFWDFVTQDFSSGAIVSSIVFLAIIVFVVWAVGFSGNGGGE